MFDSWWHHLVKMLIADNKAVSIFALFRLLEIDTTLMLHKIKGLSKKSDSPFCYCLFR